MFGRTGAPALHGQVGNISYITIRVVIALRNRAMQIDIYLLTYKYRTGVQVNIELTNKIDIFLRKAVKWGYAQKVTFLSELLRNADEKLFSKMRSSNHSIHQLLPPAKTLPIKLRSIHCVFALPQCNYNLYKSSFVLRNLFLDAY